MSQTEHMIESIPESEWQVSRRSFIKKLAGGVAAAGLLGGSRLASAGPRPGPLAEKADALSPADMGDERFWLAVKDQFTLRDGLAMMNAANLCPSPYPVMETVFHYTRDLDADASFQNRGKYGAMRDEARAKLEKLLGADPDTIAIVRNTSEANNIAGGGLALKAGDEVVLSDLNHPSNKDAWEVRAKRYGFSVKYVHVDVPQWGQEEIIKAFRDALTSRTRVLSFTHVSNTTGLTMPAKALCALARERGIFVLVDGAQSFGALKITLTDMGCDAYTGSAHKWFMGPKEAGILYVRKERIPEIWPSIVTAGWRDELLEGNKAQKFEVLGQRDDSAIAAVGRTVDFHNMLGADRVEARMRQVANAIKEGVSKLPGVTVTTPMTPELSGGVVIFKPGDLDARKVFGKLYTDYHIAGAGMGPNVRLSPHIYNTMAEADRAVKAVAEMIKNGV